MKFGKSLVVLGMATIMCSSTVFGATENKKVEATLVTNKVVKDNQQVLEGTELINYNGSLYVPLRKFGEVADITINYKDGVVYLGDNNTISVDSTNNTTNLYSKYEDVLPSMNKNGGATKVKNTEYYKNLQDYIDEAHRLIKGTLKDPMSVVFDYDREGYPEIWVSDGVLVVCVKYKAKNGFGGYEDGSEVVTFTGFDITTGGIL